MNELNRKEAKSSQVWSLLLVVGSGVIFAFILAFTMLYIYNPSGGYFAENLLLAPENLTLKLLSRRGLGAESAPNTLQFSWFDAKNGKWEHRPADPDKYREFYAMIKGDKSLSSVSEDIKDLFNMQNPLTLSVMLNITNKTTNDSSMSFSVAQFAQNTNYYRIELRVQGESGQWVYFYHQGSRDEFFSHKITNLFLDNQ